MTTSPRADAAPTGGRETCRHSNYGADYMRRTLTILAIIGALALAACSSGDGDSEPPDSDLTDLAEATENAPPCSETFAPGRPVAEVLADNDAGPCYRGDDPNDVHIAVVAFRDCADGTRIHQVEGYGWGRDGDVWQGTDAPPPSC